MSRPVKVAAAQLGPAGDKAEMTQRICGFLERAAAAGVQLVGFPELALTPYFCMKNDREYEQYFEPVDGEHMKVIIAKAKSVGIAAIVPFGERDGIQYFNSSVIIDQTGRIAGRYRKIHIPGAFPIVGQGALVFEKMYFTPGDLGFKVFTTPDAKIGTLVCWDQWYPEAARLTALQGAEVIFYPTAIGWHPREKSEFGEAQHSAWETIMRGHAIANGTYVCAVNRVGHEVIVGEGLEFWGQSFICDPFGRVLQRGSTDREEILVVECSRKLMEDVRRNWPFFRDRRIDAYSGVTQRVAD